MGKSAQVGWERYLYERSIKIAVYADEQKASWGKIKTKPRSQSFELGFKESRLLNYAFKYVVG